MNIGEAARVSGVSTKMIRYYEQIALIRPADRTDGNYRNFSEPDVIDLKFIQRGRLAFLSRRSQSYSRFGATATVRGPTSRPLWPSMSSISEAGSPRCRA